MQPASSSETARARRPPRRARTGRERFTSPTRPSSPLPCRSPASTCSRRSPATKGSTRSSSANRCWPPTSPPRSRFASTRVSTGIWSTCARTTAASWAFAPHWETASTSTRAGARRRPSRSSVLAASIPSLPREQAKWSTCPQSWRASRRSPRSRATTRRSRPGRRSRRRTSSSPAVAASAARRDSRSSRSWRRRSAARSPRRAPSSTRAGTRTRRRWARRGRPWRRSSTSPAGSRGRSNTRWACRARARSSP